MACRILVLWPGWEPVPPAVEAWSSNHWAAREVLIATLLETPYESQLSVKQEDKSRMDQERLSVHSPASGLEFIKSFEGFKIHREDFPVFWGSVFLGFRLLLVWAAMWFPSYLSSWEFSPKASSVHQNSLFPFLPQCNWQRGWRKKWLWQRPGSWGNWEV